MTVTPHKGSNYLDMSSYGYRKFEDLKLWAVDSARTVEDQDTTNWTRASRLFDANGQVVADLNLRWEGSDKTDPTLNPVSYYHNWAYGVGPISRLRLVPAGFPIVSWNEENIFFWNGTPQGQLERYFLGTNGEYLGLYRQQLNSEYYNSAPFFPPQTFLSQQKLFGGRGYEVKPSWAQSEVGRNGTFQRMGYLEESGGFGMQTAYDQQELVLASPIIPQDTYMVSRLGFLSTSYGQTKWKDYLSGPLTNVSTSNVQNYLIRDGESSYEEIADTNFGDTSFASQIALFNGRMPNVSNDNSSNDVLSPGQMLRMPSYLPIHHSAQTSQNYQRFMKIMLKNLQPVIENPEDDSEFWSTLVTVIALVAAVIATGGAGIIGIGGLAGAAAGTAGAAGVAAGAAAATVTASTVISTMAVGAAVAGMVEIAGQGLLVGFGIQQQIDFKRAMLTALSAGIGAGANVGGWFNIAGLAKYEILQAMVTQGALNVTQQLMTMAFTGKSFDFSSLLASIATAPIGKIIKNPDISKIKSSLEKEINLGLVSGIRSAVSSLTESAITGRFSLASLAANLIGAELQTYAPEAIQSYRDHQNRLQQQLQDSQKQVRDPHPNSSRNLPKPDREKQRVGKLNSGSANQKAKPLSVSSVDNSADESFEKVKQYNNDTRIQLKSKTELATEWLEQKKLEAETVQAQSKQIDKALSYRASQTQSRFWDYIDAFNHGVEMGRDSVVSMFAHPIDTVENVGILGWDTLNLTSDFFTGQTTQGSLLRNQARVLAAVQFGQNLMHASGPQLVQTITAGVSNVILTGGTGAGLGAGVRAVSKITAIQNLKTAAKIAATSTGLFAKRSEAAKSVENITAKGNGSFEGESDFGYLNQPRIIKIITKGSTGNSATSPASRFASKDPGVPETINAIETKLPGTVKQSEILIYGPGGKVFTDLDIVTDTHVIQVKVGSGKGIVGQIERSQTITDRPVIGFDASKLVGKKGFKPTVLRNAQQKGLIITDDIEHLLNILGDEKNAVHNLNF